VKGEIELRKISLTDSIQLNIDVNRFVESINKKEIDQIKRISLELIDCSLCITRDYNDGPPSDYIIAIDTFINLAFQDFIDSPLFRAIKTRGFTFSERFIPDIHPRNLPKTYDKDLVIYEAWVQTYEPNEWAIGHEGQSHCFQFVKINGEFKFYGLDSVP